MNDEDALSPTNSESSTALSSLDGWGAAHPPLLSATSQPAPPKRSREEADLAEPDGTEPDRNKRQRLDDAAELSVDSDGHFGGGRDFFREASLRSLLAVLAEEQGERAEGLRAALDQEEIEFNRIYGFYETQFPADKRKAMFDSRREEA